MHDKANCDLKTTRDREDVLNDEYDAALLVWERLSRSVGDQQIKAHWWDYTIAIHASLFGGLRVGTDYDYENLLAIQGYGVRK